MLTRRLRRRSWSRSPPATTGSGCCGGAVAGMAVSLIMVLFCVRLGLDQIVVGIAIVLSRGGRHERAARHLVLRAPTRACRRSPTSRCPILSDMPILGGSVFSQPLIVYLGVGHRRPSSAGPSGAPAGAWSCAPRASDRTPWTPPASASCAPAPSRELLCGALAGVGGAYLSIVGAGTFVPFVTNGMGFIAIVIAMLARGRPGGRCWAGCCSASPCRMTTALQLVGVQIPVDVVQMLPFISVIVVLVVFVRDARLPVRAGAAVPARKPLMRLVDEFTVSAAPDRAFEWLLDLRARGTLRARRRDRRAGRRGHVSPGGSRSSWGP